jgi:hypothetical protein
MSATGRSLSNGPQPRSENSSRPISTVPLILAIPSRERRRSSAVRWMAHQQPSGSFHAAPLWIRLAVKKNKKKLKHRLVLAPPPLQSFGTISFCCRILSSSSSSHEVRSPLAAPPEPRPQCTNVVAAAASGHPHLGVAVLFASFLSPFLPDLLPLCLSGNTQASAHWCCCRRQRPSLSHSGCVVHLLPLFVWLGITLN